jgi:hypothetical protein
VNNIVLVKVGHGVQDLLDSLGGVLFGEFALVANSVEQLSTSGELSDDVKLVLCAASRC